MSGGFDERLHVGVARDHVLLFDVDVFPRCADGVDEGLVGRGVALRRPPKPLAAWCGFEGRLGDLDDVAAPRRKFGQHGYDRYVFGWARVDLGVGEMYLVAALEDMEDFTYCRARQPAMDIVEAAGAGFLGGIGFDPPHAVVAGRIEAVPVDVDAADIRGVPFRARLDLLHQLHLLVEDAPPVLKVAQ